MPRRRYRQVAISLVLFTAGGLLFAQKTRWSSGESFIAMSPTGARLAGLLSLVFWIAIIAAGRAIAYGPGYDL
jgi:hypothetical protein